MNTTPRKQRYEVPLEVPSEASSESQSKSKAMHTEEHQNTDQDALFKVLCDLTDNIFPNIGEHISYVVQLAPYYQNRIVIINDSTIIAEQLIGQELDFKKYESSMRIIENILKQNNIIGFKKGDPQIRMIVELNYPTTLTIPNEYFRKLPEPQITYFKTIYRRTLKK